MGNNKILALPIILIFTLFLSLFVQIFVATTFNHVIEPLQLLIITFLLLLSLWYGLQLSDQKLKHPFYYLSLLFLLIFGYILLPSYFGFFVSPADSITYIFLLIVLTFLVPLVPSTDDWKEILKSIAPIATLATLGLALIGYLTNIPIQTIEGEKIASIGLATWGGRFLLYSTILLFNLLLLEKGKIKLIEKIPQLSETINDTVLILKIAITLLFGAGLFLLLKSFLILTPIQFLSHIYNISTNVTPP
jgi:hypothetical protein